MPRTLPVPGDAAAAPSGGRRERAWYRKFYEEARRQLQAEDYLERQRARSLTDYGTTYEGTHGQGHGRPGFEPAVERQLREGAALSELRPLDGAEPSLSLWYCLQRAGAGRRVSPAHAAPHPFRRTSAFTTPTHLSLHECPVEQVRPLGRARVAHADQLQARGWLPTAGLEWRAAPAATRPHRYPLADVFADVGKKYWCDRPEESVRQTAAAAGS